MKLLSLILKPDADRTMGLVTFVLIRERAEDNSWTAPTGFQLFVHLLMLQVVFGAKNRSWIPRHEGCGLVSWRGLLMNLQLFRRREA